MSTTRGANKSRHRVFTDRRERTGRHESYAALPATEPYRRAIRFQGPPSCYKEKRTLPGAPANVPDFACVTTHYPRPGSGILTRFPFDSRALPEKGHIQTEFSYLLGSTHPCPITVHMEPFSTSVFKVLI